MRFNRILKPFSLLFMAALFASCVPRFLAKPTSTPLPPTVTPTPTPRTLTICMGQEPDSLYPYGTLSIVSRRVMGVIFFGGLERINGGLTSQILGHVPSQGTDDVILEAVDVKNGDEVVSADGNLAYLAPGLAVFPHGCTSADCVQTWDGKTPLQLDRLKVKFTLKESIKWSDGKQLTAADSVYAFKLAADSSTPVLKDQIDLTASYTALDDRNIEWIGKPGYLTTNFENIFWQPLPQHLWEQLSPAQLLTSEEANKRPTGWGPYSILSWTPGQKIHMVKNPFYFRAGEGLPKFDFLDIVFMNDGEDPVQAVNSGKCDWVDPSGIPAEDQTQIAAGQKSGQFKWIIQSGESFEFLALGIKPVSYDDSYFPFGTDRPAIFDDVRTRQAIAACINRQGINDQFNNGAVPIPTNIFPSNFGENATPTSPQVFDLAKADELLTAAGWQDYDKNPATPRASVNVKNVPNGRFLSISLVSSDSISQKLLAEKISSALQKCGFAVTLNSLPLAELYKPAPDGLVFGRKFDLALLSIQMNEKSTCQMFSSQEIPTQLNFWMGKTSGGLNFTGFSNTEVDAACTELSRSGMNSQLELTDTERLNNLINQHLPIIPLWSTPKTAIFRNDSCGVKMDSGIDAFYASMDSSDHGPSCSK